MEITTEMKEEFLEYCSLGNLQHAEHLIEKFPVIVDYPLDDEGTTGVMMATRFDQEKIVKLLIENGADISITDNWGYTVLFIAARYERMGILRFLIEIGADLNIKNNSGCTALILASQYGKTAAAKILIENGASIDAKDHHDFNVFSYTGFHSNTLQSQKESIRGILKALT